MRLFSVNHRRDKRRRFWLSQIDGAVENVSVTCLKVSHSHRLIFLSRILSDCQPPPNGKHDITTISSDRGAACAGVRFAFIIVFRARENHPLGDFHVRLQFFQRRPSVFMFRLYFVLFGRATAGHRANQLILISTRTRSLFILLREYLRDSAL